MVINTNLGYYTTLQVATILVAMVPKILELATSFLKKSP